MKAEDIKIVEDSSGLPHRCVIEAVNDGEILVWTVVKQLPRGGVYKVEGFSDGVELYGRLGVVGYEAKKHLRYASRTDGYAYEEARKKAKAYIRRCIAYMLKEHAYVSLRRAIDAYTDSLLKNEETINEREARLRKGIDEAASLFKSEARRKRFKEFAVKEAQFAYRGIYPQTPNRGNYHESHY